MTPLGLVEATVQSAQTPVPAAPELQVRFEETLASTGRVWVRGRLMEPNLPGNQIDQEPSWWKWWRRHPEPAAAPPPVHLETRISGQVLEAKIPLQPDGRFEATFAADLPVARRGWRIARNRVAWGERTAEKCSAVLKPPDQARGVVVVLLPLAYTSKPHGAQHLANSDLAARLAPVLRRLHRRASGAHAFYYLACAAPDSDALQAELALATTTLGWPHGNFVLLPADRGAVLSTFAEGLDRLRWLFAGSLDLVVLNLEPTLALLLPPCLEPKDDRATVRRLLNPGDDLSTLFNSVPANAAKEPTGYVRPTRAGLVPRYPVVFCHGMLAFSTLRMQLPEDLNSFSPLREFLRERGYRALFPQVAPTSGVAARAQQLCEQIRRWTDEPVNVIAHSMGGLDARYLITHLGMADRVRSLTTIATPHRGTYLAEWFISSYRQRVPLLLALEAMGINVDGFRDCRPDACKEFNARTPDMPGVHYFSFGAAVSGGHVTPVLRRAWSLLTAMEGPNDGMVSTASAMWGEYLGTLYADHFAQTPDMTFVRPGEDFDALGFYFRLLENLARRGF
jgi:pimeloyl-ACP methyl ester carboxylesterase